MSSEKATLVTAESIALPRRSADSHKGDYGRAFILAGSVGYSGAPVMAARAASRAGAGLVFLGVPEAIYQIAAIKCDGEMAFPLPCDGEGKISAAALDIILNRLAGCSAALVGPGLGQSADIREIVSAVTAQSKVPLILDADGINALSGNLEILDSAACPVILTPHEGEFNRLGGDLRSGDRTAAAVKFAVAHGCTLVLKGHRTVTALPDGDAYINTTGSPALAKGGSGDVLAGMILGMLGQKMQLKEAVTAAVFLHGLAGDLCAERLGEYSVTPGDVIDAIPEAILTLKIRDV